jgi:hypothetical protein
MSKDAVSSVRLVLHFGVSVRQAGATWEHSASSHLHDGHLRRRTRLDDSNPTGSTEGSLFVKMRDCFRAIDLPQIIGAFTQIATPPGTLPATFSRSAFL